MISSQVTEHPITVQQHVDALVDARAGAVATFLGQVRNHDPAVAGEVLALEYTAHPDAEAVLSDLASAAAGRKGVLGVAVSHRVGRLEVGAAALIAAVSSAHRDLATTVCRELVEAIKAQLPVWKREILADGSHHWVGT